MTFEPAVSPSRFRLEEALQATFEAVFANLRVFVLLALVLSAAPNFVAQLAFPAAGVATLRSAGPGAGLFVAGLFVKPILGLVCAALLQGALTRGVVDHLNGAKADFATCLRAGLVAGPALVAISLIFGIALLFGFLLLIAPGLFLIALWTPAGAVQVVERRGVFAAFGRASELTEGNRWAVLIVMVVVAILSWVVSGVGSALAASIAMATGNPLAVAGALAGTGGLTPMLVVVSAVNALTIAVASILTSAAPAAIYSGLRRSREGAGPAELAALFD